MGEAGLTRYVGKFILHYTASAVEDRRGSNQLVAPKTFLVNNLTPGA